MQSNPYYYNQKITERRIQVIFSECINTIPAAPLNGCCFVSPGASWKVINNRQILIIFTAAKSSLLMGWCIISCQIRYMMT